MFPCYLEVEKTGSQLFLVNSLTNTVARKKISYQEHGKNVSLLFGSGKNWRLLQLFGDKKKWIPAIRRLKNGVHNCQEQGKRL